MSVEQSLTITPRETKPFSEGSLRKLVKSFHCSCSADVLKLLYQRIPELIQFVPSKRILNFQEEKPLKLICIKKWFEKQLNEQNLSRKQKLTICQNSENLLTKVIESACEVTVKNNKKILQANTVETSLNSYFYYLKLKKN